MTEQTRVRVANWTVDTRGASATRTFKSGEVVGIKLADFSKEMYGQFVVAGIKTRFGGYATAAALEAAIKQVQGGVWAAGPTGKPANPRNTLAKVLAFMAARDKKRLTAKNAQGNKVHGLSAAKIQVAGKDDAFVAGKLASNSIKKLLAEMSSAPEMAETSVDAI